MYKVKKLVCTLLAVCIISTTLAQPVQAFTGAEGAILGGGAGLASISLTAPQVALLVAAGFGLVVAVENADKLAEGMTAALNHASAGVDAGAEILAEWFETARKGSIAISSAPAWIAAAIKSWVGSLYNSTPSTATFLERVSAGTPILQASFWANSGTFSCSQDVDVIRCSDYTEKNGYFNYTIYLVMISTSPFTVYKPDGFTSTPSKYLTPYSSVPYVYYHTQYVAGSPKIDTTYDYDVSAISAAKSLPTRQQLGAVGYGPASGHENIALWWASKTNSGTLPDYPEKSICPDAKVGGIGAALEEGKSIDAVNMPDLDVAGSKSICPDGVLDGSIPIADTVADVIVGLSDGTLSWSDYVTDVAVGTPTISVPVEGTETGVIDYPITDTGVSDTPIETNPDTPGEGAEVPEGLAPYTVQLKDFFPFCIPFDIVDFVGVLCADPVAPSFEWTFTQYSGQKDTLEIDLSPFDEVAQLLRNMELLLFIIGLAFLTRNLIRG